MIPIDNLLDVFLTINFKWKTSKLKLKHLTCGSFINYVTHLKREGVCLSVTQGHKGIEALRRGVQKLLKRVM